MSESGDSRADWVRQRAYEIWEGEGASHGRHDDHWRQAEAEYDARDSTPAAAAKTAGDIEADLIETPPPAEGPAPQVPPEGRSAAAAAVETEEDVSAKT